MEDTVSTGTCARLVKYCLGTCARLCRNASIDRTCPSAVNEIDALAKSFPHIRARDARELAGIYAEIDKLEPVARQGRSVRPVIERYPWPLAGAVLLGLLGLLLRRRRP